MHGSVRRVPFSGRLIATATTASSLCATAAKKERGGRASVFAQGMSRAIFSCVFEERGYGRERKRENG